MVHGMRERIRYKNQRTHHTPLYIQESERPAGRLKERHADKTININNADCLAFCRVTRIVCSLAFFGYAYDYTV